MTTRIFIPRLLALPLALPLILLGNGTSQAQNVAPKARTIYLYNASLGTAPAGINAAKSGPWGNGSVAVSRRVDYEGAPVLELVTRNFQEGARFDFTTPVNLDAYRDTGFLRLRLRFRDDAQTGGSGGGGGDGRGNRGNGGDGRTGNPRRENFEVKPRWNGSAQFGAAFPGGFPGGGFPGGGVGEDGFNPAIGPVLPTQITDIREIAVTLLREKGVTVGRIPVDLKNTVADEGGWRLFVLPIKNMTSTSGASGAVKRAIFTSDAQDTIYLAQAAIVIESGDMTASIRRPQDVAGTQFAEIEVKPGALTLIADVEAGAADPVVEWNFDADNVGNLPPGALSSPPAIGGEGGMDEMRGGEMRGGEMRGNRPPIRRAPNPGARPSATLPNRVGGRVFGGPGGGVGAGGDTGGLEIEAGPRIDARGITATFEYPNEEQNYRVEVTVSDRSGTKPPVKTSILVRVRG